MPNGPSGIQAPGRAGAGEALGVERARRGRRRPRRCADPAAGAGRSPSTAKSSPSRTAARSSNQGGRLRLPELGRCLRRAAARQRQHDDLRLHLAHSLPGRGLRVLALPAEELPAAGAAHQLRHPPARLRPADRATRGRRRGARRCPRRRRSRMPFSSSPRRSRQSSTRPTASSSASAKAPTRRDAVEDALERARLETDHRRLQAARPERLADVLTADRTA